MEGDTLVAERRKKIWQDDQRPGRAHKVVWRGSLKASFLLLRAERSHRISLHGIDDLDTLEEIKAAASDTKSVVSTAATARYLDLKRKKGKDEFQQNIEAITGSRRFLITSS